MKIESEEIFIESGNFTVQKNNFFVKKSLKKSLIGYENLNSLSSFEIKNNFDYLLAQNIAKNFNKFKEI